MATIPQAFWERRPVGSLVEGRLELGVHQLHFYGLDVQLSILYSLIQSVERRPAVSLQPRPGTYQPLLITTRHFQLISILLPNSNDDSAKIYQMLKQFICISSVERHYAFTYQPRQPYAIDGWSFVDPKEDFTRLGVGRSSNIPWRFTEFNQDHAVSPTYPRLLVVPEKISDAVLFHAAKFRSRGRLPALTFVFHQNNASITRSSQPLIGLKAKRSIQDEKLLEAIFDSNLDLVPTLKKNVIIDARPLGNALANRAMGAGTESTENYKNCKRLFMGIDNIHVMRDSLNRLTDAVLAPDNGMDKWNQALDNSSWLKHIRTIMESTKLIVQTILDGGNVLIHCSDGWDRTAQLSSLASIVLDPHYRTLKGFQTLIEKEWLSFGHKFSERCGHINSPPPQSSSSSSSGSNSNLSSASSGKEEKETAPIFLQFLECTHLLMRQFPGRFEFNEQLLYDLYAAAHSCQFGTFMLNNERERMEAGLAKRTHSFWSHVLQYRSKYLSPVFSADTPAADQILDFSTSTKDVPYWFEFYSRFEEDNYGGSLAIEVPKERRISVNGGDALKAEPNPFLNRPRSINQILQALQSAVDKGQKASFIDTWKRSPSCHGCKSAFYQTDIQYPLNRRNYCLECIDSAS